MARRAIAPLAAMAGLLLGLACERSPTGAPNVLFLVADTLRPDSLECYGGETKTPNICGLARDGVLFERVYAAGPWTLPSAVALLTGTQPGVHQMPRKPGRNPEFYVGDEQKLFTESLRDAGFRVVVEAENRLLVNLNAAQGAEAVRCDAQSSRDGPADDDWRYESVRRVAHLLETLVGGEKPFFLLKWFLDPHSRYIPPEHLVPEPGPDLPRPASFYRRLGLPQIPTQRGKPLRDYAPRFTKAERRYLRRLYDAEIASVDERVGVLLDTLERLDVRDRTIVVFASDHGEAFGEHLERRKRRHPIYHHGVSYYDELVRVPLIFSGPGIRRGVRVAAPVSLLDVVPTLAELLGVPPPDDADGVSLAGVLRSDETPREPRRLYLEGAEDKMWSDALVEGRYKLVAHGPDGELYDLAADPGEQLDLSQSSPDVKKRMMRKLRWARTRVARRRKAVSSVREPERADSIERTREHLRALGYVE